MEILLKLNKAKFLVLCDPFYTISSIYFLCCTWDGNVHIKINKMIFLAIVIHMLAYEETVKAIPWEGNKVIAFQNILRWHVL